MPFWCGKVRGFQTKVKYELEKISFFWGTTLSYGDLNIGLYDHKKPSAPYFLGGNA